VLVEKILRVQPDVKKLYLLVRAPDAASAEQRILSQVSQSHVIAFDDQIQMLGRIQTGYRLPFIVSSSSHPSVFI
jgi:hypothetical protein